MKKLLSTSFSFLIAGAGLFGLQTGAQAGNLTNPYPPVFCGTVLCNSLFETKLHQVGNPFAFQVYANAGECLQIGVSDTTNDMEVTVVSPNGFAYNADYFAGTDEVLIINTPTSGSYTVIAAQWLGGGVGSRTLVSMGRYPLSDTTNCPFFDLPLSDAGDSAASKGKASPACGGDMACLLNAR